MVFFSFLEILAFTFFILEVFWCGMPPLVTLATLVLAIIYDHCNKVNVKAASTMTENDLTTFLDDEEYIDNHYTIDDYYAELSAMNGTLFDYDAALDTAVDGIMKVVDELMNQRDVADDLTCQDTAEIELSLPVESIVPPPHAPVAPRQPMRKRLRKRISKFFRRISCVSTNAE